MENEIETKPEHLMKNGLFTPITKRNSTHESTEHKALNVTAISLNKLVPFAKHPFLTYEGERLKKLADSISVGGLISPIAVRPNMDGNYEILSGHNRVEAVKLLGQNKINAIIMEGLSDKEAERIVIESNLNQQSFADWKYSQQIRVIKLYNKYIQENSQQGKRSDLADDSTCVHTEHKSADRPTRPKIRDKISRQLGISSTVFERYRSIAKLDDGILNSLCEMLDERRLGFMAAYRLSQIKQEETIAVLNFFKSDPESKLKGSTVKSLYDKSKNS
ncbi:ParB N-terminal domain-containing protein, partial [Anaerospora hongkongensis]|uniref:ParB N-terminal domain-containing protein n=1 Tax=Anaerospora hongkongensis TaxID=244830 RepID=UPI002FDB7F70